MCQNVVKKMPNNYFKTSFWSSSKNWRLDVKVCADPSWLLVFKYCFKKCCSLTNYWVLMFEVNVKNVTEKKGRGPACVWGICRKLWSYSTPWNLWYLNQMVVCQENKSKCNAPTVYTVPACASQPLQKFCLFPHGGGIKVRLGWLWTWNEAVHFHKRMKFICPM